LGDASAIGFSAGISSNDNKKPLSETLKEVQPEDLQRFGLIPEFIGRLPVITSTNELDKDMLVKILTEPKNSLIDEYTKLISMDDADLVFTEKALEAIAQKALDRQTGARGLRSIIEKALLDTMFDLPSTENVTHIIVDKETITQGKQPRFQNKPNKKKEIKPKHKLG
jgi:ATP-dependent Clp protease ATP-binding subunit ClpX